MKLLSIAFLIIAFNVNAMAQNRDKCPSVVSMRDTGKILIADETTISYVNDNAKIECDNNEIFMKIFKTHDQLFKRFTCTWKHDRYGSYKHYVIYLNKDDAQIIVLWINKNL